MQKPPADDDEDDTAFGGLAPRSGPKPLQPDARRRGVHKWLPMAVVVVILVVGVLLYFGQRI